MAALDAIKITVVISMKKKRENMTQNVAKIIENKFKLRYEWCNSYQEIK